MLCIFAHDQKNFYLSWYVNYFGCQKTFEKKPKRMDQYLLKMILLKVKQNPCTSQGTLRNGVCEEFCKGLPISREQAMC